LLAEGGKHTKELQAKVNEELKEFDSNVYISFDKDKRDSDEP
jgi:hypothetical protein